MAWYKSIGIVHQHIWSSLNNIVGGYKNQFSEDMLPNQFPTFTQYLHIIVVKILNIPDLDSLSAGLTCIAFCICDKKKKETWNTWLLYNS